MEVRWKGQSTLSAPATCADFVCPFLNPPRAMRRSLRLVILLLAFGSAIAVSSKARPAPDTTKGIHGGRAFLGFHGGLMQMQGQFANTLGAQHGGFQATFGLQAPSGLAVGLQLFGGELQKRSETAHLDSGLDVDLKTTTSLTRVGLFGQYGPRVHAFRPYAEGLLGVHVVSTDTKIPDDSDGAEDHQTDNRKTHNESVAPAAGGAVGMEIDLEGAVGYSVGLRVEGRRTYGGSVDYLFYDGGEFVERSSRTSTSTLSVGLTMSY